MTKYIIAGNSGTVNKFIEKRPSTYFSTKEGKYLIGEKLVNCWNEKIFYKIEENDTIILLKGWFAKSWAKEALKVALANYPNIKFEYYDGVFGEKERKDLKSDRIHDRFEILDFSDH